MECKIHRDVAEHQTDSCIKTCIVNFIFLQCARNNEIYCLRLLLDIPKVVKGINHLDDTGMAPIHYAARFNNYEALKLMVDKGKAGGH